MAKPANKLKDEKVEELDILKEKKKSKKPLLIITAIILLLGGIGIIIRFNVGNLTEKYLRTYLEKVPIVNNLLLPTKKSEDQYENYTKEQFVQDIEELKNELEKKEQILDMDQDTIEKLEKEIDRLKEIEAQQIQYEKNKQEFDEMIASQSPTDFMKFYKEVYPDTAAEIYERMLFEDKQIQDVEQYVEPFETMDPANAAKVFEEMISTDIDLVVLILKNIDSEQQASILGEMDPIEAARVVKTMAP